MNSKIVNSKLMSKIINPSQNAAAMNKVGPLPITVLNEHLEVEEKPDDDGYELRIDKSLRFKLFKVMVDNEKHASPYEKETYRCDSGKTPDFVDDSSEYETNQDLNTADAAMSQRSDWVNNYDPNQLDY